MSHLPVRDLIKIGTTPDLDEWKSFDTWEQAGKVGLKVLGDWSGL